ncbi:hypothetical protein [Chryseobacterium gambrini]|uniref:hypothetical protein n=1 Tax=Chryseobacterium gambrini TaxID=373672 RepID=UPI003D0B65DA
MKKHFFSAAIFASLSLTGQIYTPTGGISGTTSNPTTGNIAIGHNTPLRKLHIANGDMYMDGPAVINFGDDARFTVSNTTIPSLSIPSYSMAQYGIAAPTTSYSAELWVSGNDGIQFFTRSAPKMTILNDGNVGIGTISPQYKLDVNGKASFSNNVRVDAKLEAKEIKVTLTPTADFVFEEKYNLPKLEDVEKHIKEKKHLPEIASAKEMEKDGVNVGEFQIKLLQKIEELTLYTIEQNKRIKELESKINK